MLKDSIHAGPQACVLGRTLWAHKDGDLHLNVAVGATIVNAVVQAVQARPNRQDTHAKHRQDHPQAQDYKLHHRKQGDDQQGRQILC